MHFRGNYQTRCYRFQSLIIVIYFLFFHKGFFSEGALHSLTTYSLHVNWSQLWLRFNNGVSIYLSTKQQPFSLTSYISNEVSVFKCLIFIAFSHFSP